MFLYFSTGVCIRDEGDGKHFTVEVFTRKGLVGTAAWIFSEPVLSLDSGVSLARQKMAIEEAILKTPSVMAGEPKKVLYYIEKVTPDILKAFRLGFGMPIKKKNCFCYINRIYYEHLGEVVMEEAKKGVAVKDGLEVFVF